MSGRQQIDLTQLEPQQLVEVRKQLDQEISHFTQSFQALQTAQAKLRDCVSSIDNLEKSVDQDMLVPMTSSLYIPGKAVKNNNYIVDIGTGYYVEKNAKDAKIVYETKITKLTEDGKKLRDILVSKNESLNSVNLILRNKMIQYEQQQQQQEKE